MLHLFTCCGCIMPRLAELLFVSSPERKGRKHQGDVNKKVLKSFQSKMATMAATFEIYFALLLN